MNSLLLGVWDIGTVLLTDQNIQNHQAMLPLKKLAFILHMEELGKGCYLGDHELVMSDHPRTVRSLRGGSWMLDSRSWFSLTPDGTV